MMGFGITWAVMLLMLMNGGAVGGGDLLDMVPTQRYWQTEGIDPTMKELVADAGPDETLTGVEDLVKDLGADDFKVRNKAKRKLEDMGPGVLPVVKKATESKDSEVAAGAAEIVQHVSERGKARAVKRLMAIRTLGENKEKSALEMLTGLESSKELFVAEYATRAVAAINGEKYEHPDRRKLVADDLAILPKDTGVVGQSVGVWKKRMTLEEAVDLSIKNMDGNPLLMWGGGGNLPKVDREHVMSRVMQEAMKIIDRVGDIRLDGVTLGVADQMKGDSGWGVAVFRGEFDRAALINAMQEVARGNGRPDSALQVSKVGDIDVLRPDTTSVVYMPSDEELVIVGSASETATAINDVVLNSLKQGKGGIEGNEKIMGLVKQVDRSGPVWVVGKVSEEMKAEQMFAAFDTFVATTVLKKDGGTFSVVGTGTDKEKVKAASDEMAAGIKASLQQLQPMMAQFKAMQPLVDFLESIKFEAKDTQVTMTGEVTDAFYEAIVSEVGGFAVLEMQQEEQRDHGTMPAN